ncbi:MAG: tetratricopeptide repeat protein [Rhodospirillales bacterium]|nr:tetratricopeptide repeat protein [Rhodospirillales bacterium]
MTVSTFTKTFRVCLVLAALTGCEAIGGKPAASPDALEKTLRQSAFAAEAEGKYAVAANHYRKLLGHKPDDQKTMIALVRNLRYTGEVKQALEILQSKAKEFGRSPAYLIELGKAKLALNDPQGAIATMKEALRAGGDNWEALTAMGIGYDLLQAHDEAWKAYQKALKISANNPAILNNMAISAALVGNLNLAISILEGAPGYARKIQQIRQNLALFYGLKGDIKKAEMLAKMDLDEESVLNNLDIYARLHKQRKNKPKKKTQAK